jgi:probable HAF family extracellular repeat protein
VGVSSLPDNKRHAFLYSQGKLSDLGTLSGAGYSAANVINRIGVIAGDAETATHFIHAVLWTGNTLVDLGTLPGGTRSRALALNDGGEVIGFSEAEGGEIHGFLYAKHHMQDLGSLGNDPIRPNAINNRTQIVGSSGVKKYLRHAFVWQNGKMQDLNRLIPADVPWHLKEAYDINNNGQIVCVGTDRGRSGDQRLLLLNPSPR